VDIEKLREMVERLVPSQDGGKRATSAAGG
jgi:hypothetical protein